MFTLDQVVPWGRSFEEYRRMFALTQDDLGRRILGCGDGPASFNAEATALGVRVTSCDPIYQFDAAQVQQRIDETSHTVLAQTKTNAHEFVWTSISSVDELYRVRLASMQAFLADYPAGKEAGRYVDAALPTLPFEDGSFDLALSSHFLFLYTQQLGEVFHQRAVLEMCRVAREVRIFPLLSLGGQPSPLVEVVRAAFHLSGLIVSIEPVGYEFQRGGNRMMRICRPAPLPEQGAPR